MANYKSSFTNGAAVDAALNAATSHKANHKSGGSDYIRIDELAAPTDTTTLNVSTSAHGLCPKGEGTGTKFLKDDLTWDSVTAGSVTYGTTAGTACEGNDTRLSDDRDPNTHATSHKDGGTDYIRLDELAAATTDARNATTSNPGLCPAGEGTGTKFLKDDLTWDTPAGGSGTDITFPGYASAYLNGAGTFSVPASSGSVFKNAIYIGKTGSGANYECDGVADNVQIQAAFTAAADGATIVFLAGDYYLTSNINRNYADLTVIGMGDVTLHFAYGNDNPVFQFNGRVIDTQSLSANSLQYTTTITLDSAALVDAGDLIELVNSDLWSNESGYSKVKTGEMYQVLSVASNVVTLTQPLIRDYTTAKSSVAYVYRPMRAVVDNIDIIHGGATVQRQCIRFNYCVDSIIRNCEVSQAGIMLIGLYSCYNVEVHSNHLHDALVSGYGYGVCIANASAYIHIHNNRVERCRHCITTGTSQPRPTNGLVRAINVQSNVLVSGVSTATNPLDCHPATLDFTVIDNDIFPDPLYAQYCISSTAGDLIFKNNRIYGKVAVGTRGYGLVTHRGNDVIEGNTVVGGGIYYDGGNAAVIRNSITIKNNVCTGTDHAVNITKAQFSKIDISGNHIKTCSGHGIYVIVPSGIAIPTRVNITGNMIDDTQYTGIYLQRAAVSYNVKAIISGNQINTPNGAGSDYSGIFLKDISKSIITDNLVYDDAGVMRYAIVESAALGGSDYNLIHSNITGGGTAGHIFTVGAHTVASDNMDL